MTANEPVAIADQSAASHGIGGMPGAGEAADDGSGDAASFLDRHGLMLALLAAWVAMLGSLYFSEVRGYAPCPLCWYQRIFMYPLTVVLAIGLARRDAGLPLYAMPLAGIGWLIASYHLLVERGFIQQSTACQVSVPCTVRYINWFGFITIPLLAWTAFAIILLGSSAVYRSGTLAAASGIAPGGAWRWRPVLSVIVPVVAAFAALWQLRW